jgi:hypothetical protein
MIVVHDWSGVLLVAFALSLSPDRQAFRRAGRRSVLKAASFAVLPRLACGWCVDSESQGMIGDFHTIRQLASFATIDHKAASGSRERRYPDYGLGEQCDKQRGAEHPHPAAVMRLISARSHPGIVCTHDQPFPKQIFLQRPSSKPHGCAGWLLYKVFIEM